MIPRKMVRKTVGNTSNPVPAPLKKGTMNRKFTMLIAIEVAYAVHNSIRPLLG
jgi:hypothetical protein